jgi:uncharacterized membrane protein YfcA
MTADPAMLAAVMGAAFLVGLSKGGLPAVGAAAVPLLALAMPPFAAAAMLLPIYIATDAVGLSLYRRSYSAPNLRILIPSGLAGVLIGWSLAARIPDAAAEICIGLLGATSCLRRWLPSRAETAPRPADMRRGWFWGVLMGLASFVAHAGGAPFQSYVAPQRLEKMAFVGTSTIVFASLNVAKAGPYWLMGSYAGADSPLICAALAVGVAGTLAGARLIRIIPDRIFFRFVTAGLFLVSVKLIADGAAAL